MARSHMESAGLGRAAAGSALCRPCPLANSLGLQSLLLSPSISQKAERPRVKWGQTPAWEPEWMLTVALSGQVGWSGGERDREKKGQGQS